MSGSKTVVKKFMFCSFISSFYSSFQFFSFSFFFFFFCSAFVFDILLLLLFLLLLRLWCATKRHICVQWAWDNVVINVPIPSLPSPAPPKQPQQPLQVLRLALERVFVTPSLPVDGRCNASFAPFAPWLAFCLRNCIRFNEHYVFN